MLAFLVDYWQWLVGAGVAMVVVAHPDRLDRLMSWLNGMIARVFALGG